tara:strand:- start:508 stop:879 length:372 start_codon:yes stop_codon:yes gene_type:complete
MENILLSDVNMNILNNCLCCGKHFNLLININKKIKNNFLNNKKFIECENEKNKNVIKILQKDCEYFKSRFYHLRNSINIAMNQNFYLFSENNNLTDENNWSDTDETESLNSEDELNYQLGIIN